MNHQSAPSAAPPAAAQSALSRRKFLVGALATAAFTIIKPELARGTAANSKLEVGIVAQGQRGRRQRAESDSSAGPDSVRATLLRIRTFFVLVLVLVIVILRKKTPQAIHFDWLRA